MPLDLGILVSGSGTNLQAILDAVAAGRLEATIRVVISSAPGVAALERAKKFGVPTRVLVPATFPSREDYDRALVEELRSHGAGWVALAGFMRLLSPVLLQAFADRVVNIHPALLPSFPGLHAPRQALRHGAKVTGCTVHFVDEGVDTGPMIAQAALAVRDTDNETSLHARIQLLEWRLYPAVLQALAEGRVRRDGRRVSVDGEAPLGELVASMGI
jgi:phosphoribosylglycinamide formyltransferase-1